MRTPLVVVMVVLGAGVARGQGDSAAAAASAPVVAAPVDSVLRRAEQMLGEGRAAAGRALVDSMLGVTAPGTAQYAEVLFTRASLAATAFETERDYRRVTVEYPSSPRADDALLRLAQLELARGSKDDARQHLMRLERDRAPSTTTPRTNLSIAHAWFEAGEPVHACAALDAAHQVTPSSEIELIHQLDYAALPCARLPKPVPPSPPPPAAVVATVARDTTPPPVVATPAPTVVATPAPTVVAPPVVAKPRAVTPPPATTGRYTVQVAAYATRAPAEDLAARLKGRGYETRVWGTAAPYRVRIGRYPTRTAAEQERLTLKSKQIDGFVVDAEP